ncbi:hypothetical protein, partial [Blastochloris sulfoviridis]|uniref:hypothetical protein n=1 Tax=Blastochloris sulfoviridis TaxID=50712 RepID=UPI001AEF0AB3
MALGVLTAALTADHLDAAQLDAHGPSVWRRLDRRNVPCTTALRFRAPARTPRGNVLQGDVTMPQIT